MATPTSSSNRSKRKTTKPVTADKGRTNRARVSTAKTTSSDSRPSNSGARVTNASQRTSTGSGRVTGTSRQALPAKSSASDLQRLQTASKTKPTRPAPRPVPKSQSRPALPPGQRGGDLVPQGTRRSRAEAKASNAAKGFTGPNRVGRSDARPALPPGKPGGAMTRASAGGALARTARGAASAGARGLVRGAGKLLGRVAVPAAIAEQAKDVFNPKDNIITRGAALGRSIERVVGSGGGSNLTPGQRNAQLAAKRGQRQGPQQTPQMVADYKAKRDARHQSLRDKMPPVKPRTSSPSSGGNSSPSRSSGGNNAPRTSAPRSQTPPKPRFTGTVDEGRKMWAEKYSSSKYDGQAIQKEAKKLLDEMKKRKEDKSNATKAGWDGNKNY